MRLAAGRLRHWITIQRKVVTQDISTGLMTTTWVDVASSLPAAFEYLSGRELIAAQAVQSEVVARVTIRARPGLDASMRIVYRGEFYDIAGVLPDNISGLSHITLPVSKGVNDG